MPIADDQIALLQTARNALHSWQDTAQGVDVTLQQVTMSFPVAEGGEPREVTFTWNGESEAFAIST